MFIIDDDESICASIQGLLKPVGLRSEVFATPKDRLQSKLSNGPSCLVLDVRLPGISGLDFQRELTAAGIDVPIIFITGYGDILMSVKAMKSVEFLTKPFRDQDLLDAIQQALESDRMNSPFRATRTPFFNTGVSKTIYLRSIARRLSLRYCFRCGTSKGAEIGCYCR